MSTNTKEETTTKVVRRPSVKNIDAAIKAYYMNYIGNKEIQDMFGCSECTAIRLKTYARDLEKERDIPMVVPHKVNSEIAFEVWRIDVKRLISNRQKLINLGIAEDISTEAKEKAPQSGYCDA